MTKTIILSPSEKIWGCSQILNSIEIIKDLKKDGFNVIILNDLASLWLTPIFKLNGFKTISLLHLFLEKVSENPLGHSIFEYNILKISAKFVDEIFSVNKNNQKVFGDKVRFIGNNVSNWFIETEKSEDAGKYDFILIARFAKQKNIPLFLELLNNLNNKLNKNTIAYYHTYVSLFLVGERLKRLKYLFKGIMISKREVFTKRFLPIIKNCLKVGG